MEAEAEVREVDWGTRAVEAEEEDALGAWRIGLTAEVEDDATRGVLIESESDAAMEGLDGTSDDAVVVDDATGFAGVQGVNFGTDEGGGGSGSDAGGGGGTAVCGVIAAVVVVVALCKPCSCDRRSRNVGSEGGFTMRDEFHGTDGGGAGKKHTTGWW